MPLSDTFSAALAYASRLHSRQLRKGSGVPYVAHLLSVCALALEHGADEEEAIAALLHDAIEDQGGAAVRDEIAARFGERVAGIVEACSDTDIVPKPPWRERKEAYLAHLRGAPPSVRLVSAADKVHNMRAIVSDYRAVGEALWERFKGGKEGTRWYYNQLVQIFLELGPAPLAEELHRTIDELDELTR